MEFGGICFFAEILLLCLRRFPVLFVNRSRLLESGIGSMKKAFLFGVGVLVVSPSLGLAQSGSVAVDAKSNIFGSGSVSNPTPAPGGGGGGLAAPSIDLAAGTGRTATFSATGSWGWAGSVFNGPDGGNFASSTSIPAVGGISGFSGPLSGHLLGVFLDDNDPTSLTPPSGLTYGSSADYALASYSPGLRQVFFIGDGVTGTGSGSQQTFFVPDEATRLFFGVADAFAFNGAAGWYADNVGSVNVEYSVVPEPGTMLVLAGLGALVARRRSR